MSFLDMKNLQSSPLPSDQLNCLRISAQTPSLNTITRTLADILVFPLVIIWEVLLKRAEVVKIPNSPVSMLVGRQCRYQD